MTRCVFGIYLTGFRHVLREDRVKTTTAEILDLINSVAQRPQMYVASPEEASALVEGLAAVALAENSGRSLQIALRDVGLRFGTACRVRRAANQHPPRTIVRRMRRTSSNLVCGV